MIESETLNLIRLEQGNFRIKGRVICRGGLELTVNKTLKASKLNSIQFVETVKYSYHLTTSDERDVFRYDNAHVHFYLGHRSEFHVHRFDEDGNEKHQSPYEIFDLEEWPTLAEVIQEADKFYWDSLYPLEQRLF
ncbi:MAG: hypothetical protein J0L70_28785 [Leptolyngbya sp. UWPOB_LEPTO1]|nr:hypothetical protein [Leptolyngbya sp. UWPOB_LEPTO1]